MTMTTVNHTAPATSAVARSCAHTGRRVVGGTRPR
ncbi:Uncharacterised protein [Mycobacteroides abscessus]|nr:Uncharacterised protein [Mycobacteroides abscessus]